MFILTPCSRWSAVHHRPRILADRTAARSMIAYLRDTVVCLSVFNAMRIVALGVGVGGW